MNMEIQRTSKVKSKIADDALAFVPRDTAQLGQDGGPRLPGADHYSGIRRIDSMIPPPRETQEFVRATDCEECRVEPVEDAESVIA